MDISPRAVITVLFILLLTWFILRHKKGRQMHVWKTLPVFYAVMYRTKFGLKAMDWLAKNARPVIKFLGTIGIAIGFLGMVFIAVTLVITSVNLFITPEAPPGAQLVLPVKSENGPIFYVPIEFWIISIFIIAIVHEYAHGVVARAYRIRVKSSGFAFLGAIVPIIPAAFVEPDEKSMQKRPLKQQLAVFGAGPFSNVLLAFICLGILIFALAPAANSMTEGLGITVTDFTHEGSAAKAAGMQQGELITMVDNREVRTVEDLRAALEDKRPGQQLSVETGMGIYHLTLGENPEDPEKPYLGVFLEPETQIKPSVEQRYGGYLPEITIWFVQLFTFLYILNLGIGLFNLLPVGPLDGGRMLHATLLRYFKKDRALKIFSQVSFFLFFIVLLNIFVPLGRWATGSLF